MNVATPGFAWERLVFVAAGLSAAALAVALVGFWRRRRDRSDKPVRSCGRCGYDVRGLTTFVCPECGSDLRTVGVVAGVPPHPMILLAAGVGSAWKRLAFLTVVVAAAVVLAGSVFVQFVARYDVYPAGEAVLEPASKLYVVRLSMGGKVRHVSGRQAAGRPGPAAGEELSVTLAPPGGVVDYNTDFRIDLPRWSYTIDRWVGGIAPAVRPAAFGRDELVRLFEEKQIDTTRPEVRAELDALMKLIDACRADLVHRVVAKGTPFRVVTAADRTTAAYAGSEPLGTPLMGVGLSLWVVVMTGVVLTRMWRLRDGGVSSLVPPALAAGPRTVTVLFSDIKDYTARSAAAPRNGAIDLVRRHRELADPVLRARRGTVVKTMGDALLVTFDSATDAALAGLDLQAAVAAYNATADGDAFELRIAVATGEVIVEAADVYGDTVNLASRLQGVAAPGGVLLSAATRALVNEREVAVEPAGEYRLNGFAAPVLAFAAKQPGG